MVSSVKRVESQTSGKLFSAKHSFFSFARTFKTKHFTKKIKCYSALRYNTTAKGATRSVPLGFNA